MATPKKVRFGLLGAGLIAPFHARSIRALDNCELAGVTDTNAERAAACAKQFSTQAYADYDAMLADKSIDVICVLTPNHLHVEPTVKAAAAGKHVLVEKPPALSLAETDEMIAACRKAGVKLGVTLQCRVRKPIQAMRAAIDEGRFGRLLQADAFMKWFRGAQYYFSDPWRSSRRSGAGVTMHHAFHYIDLLQYLIGPAREVQARMTNKAHKEVELEDTLLGFIEYANGAQGVVEASTALWPGTDIRIEITGENGTAIMVGERMELWKFKDERPEDERIRGLGRGSVATAASGAADFVFAGHKIVLEGMAKAVRENVDPIITAQSARNTLEITLGMYKSAAEGKAVQLPLANEEGIWG